jgi:hypothetical protein
MYLRGLSKLREANPELSESIDRLDQYLAEISGGARLHITASTVATAIDVSRDLAIGLLMAAAKLGLLRLKFRLLCPVTHGGIRDFSELADIPKQFACDLCGEQHEVSPDDIEYFFELKDLAVGAKC